MTKKKKEKKEKSGGGIFTPLMTLGSNIKKIENKETKSEREFLNKRLETKNEGEVKKLEYQRGLNKKEYSKEKGKVRIKAYSQVVDRATLGAIAQRVFKGKVLRKPSVTLIHSLNAEKAIMRGTGNLALVRPEIPREYNPENRSLFFNDSFVKEKERDRKWLLE
jgi:hypothetical protein